MKPCADATKIPIDQHFVVKAVAERWGVSDDVVYSEMDAGRLPYIQIGTRRSIPESAILAYTREHAFGNHPQRPLPERGSRKVAR